MADGHGGAGGVESSGSGDGRDLGMPVGRLTGWLLLHGSRWAVTAGLLALTFLALLGLGAIDPFDLGRSIPGTNPVALIFQGFLGAIITGVTLVVTINQLVLSQELGPVGDQRGRMEEALAFRQDVEEDLDLAVSPAEPAAFLGALADVTVERAEAFRDAVETGPDDDRRRRVDAYVDGIVASGEAVSRRLEDAQFGTFGVVSAALAFDYSGRIHEGRRLRADHRDDRSEEAEARLDALLDALTWFGPTREHVKTLYFRWELVDLSRAMLAVAVPALVVVLGMGLFGADGRSVPGTTLGLSNLLWVTVGATTVGVAPFMVLISYVLRIGTVAKRTLAIGPFVLRETGGAEDTGRP